MRVEVARGSIFIILAVLCISFLSGIVHAESSEISVVAVDNNIAPEDIAEYKLYITNNAESPQTFTIYSFSGTTGWSVDPKNLADKVIENIAPGDTYETIIIAYPTDDNLEPSIYYLDLSVDGNLEAALDTTLKVYLGVSESDAQYIPSITAEVEMDSELDPREMQTVVLNLENKNPRNLSDLVLHVESELEELTLDIPASLEPLESKTQEFTVQLDQFSQAKDYTIFFVFDLGGETVKVVEKEITIPVILTDFDWELNEESGFLKRSQTFTLTNNGNVENSQEFRYAIGTIDSLFISSEEGYVLRENGQQYLVWDVELKPSESIELVANYNYQIIFYLLIAFLLIVGFYLIVRLPVSVRKKAITVVGNHDGLSEVKVLLEVKNKRKTPVKDVLISDIVPGIANVEKTIELGTLKPHKVKSTAQGSKIDWQLSELDGYEQRIISYKIKAKLNILGPFRLPRAIVQFVGKRGKVQKAYSNMFRLDPNMPQDK